MQKLAGQPVRLMKCWEEQRPVDGRTRGAGSRRQGPAISAL